MQMYFYSQSYWDISKLVVKKRKLQYKNNFAPMFLLTVRLIGKDEIN